MRAVLIALLFVALAFAHGHHGRPQSVNGKWLNRTLDHISTTGDKTPFSFSYPVVPTAASPYHLEVEVKFAELYDQVVVDFNLASGKAIQYIVKEKGQKVIVVLQDALVSSNGWTASDISCGQISGTISSKSKIASIKAALQVKIPAHVSAENCPGVAGGDEPRRWHNRRHAMVGIPVLLVLAATFILCCCCCVRAVARRRCRKACKPVEEAYPAEVVLNSEPATETAEPEPSYVTEEQLAAAGYAMYPFPVMAMPADGVQYALVPVTPTGQAQQ